MNFLFTSCGMKYLILSTIFEFYCNTNFNNSCAEQFAAEANFCETNTHHTKKVPKCKFFHTQTTVAISRRKENKIILTME